LYYFFNPHALLKKAFGDKAPKNLKPKGQGGKAFLKIAIACAVVIIGLSLIAAAFDSSDDSDATTLGNSSTLDLPRAQPATIPTYDSNAFEMNQLKQQYDSCAGEYESMGRQLDSINSRLDYYESMDDTYSYNALVPSQNSLVRSMDSKYDECESIRTSYNSKL